MPPHKTIEFEHAHGTSLVRRAGSSSELHFVLVHGIGVASRYWARLVPPLARSGTVHVLELPGFGSAPQPREALSVPELASVVTAYCRFAELDGPVLVGHSMGAQIVVEASVQDPELGFVVVAIAPVVDPQAPTALRQGLRLLHDFVHEPPAANLAVWRDYVRTGPRYFLASLPHMLRYRLEEAAARLEVPLLVLRGSRDPIVPLSWAQQLCRIAPQSRVVTVHGAPHAVHFTHAEEVAAEILSHVEVVARLQR